ncbi:tRNA pseudouridine(55) synthase TruB [Actinobacillus suis]
MSYADLQNLSENQPLEALDQYLLPLDTAVESLPKINLTAEQTKAVGFGQRVKFENIDQTYGQVRLFSEHGQFLGVAEITNDNVIRPSRMVNL